jgi:hypothetical protein
MKFRVLTAGLLICFGAQADLESASQKLSNCVVGYAESQINSSKEASRITQEAFTKCTSQLSALHDAIGPDKSQWASLDEKQKQSITKIRDQTTARIREQISSQVLSYITESSKGS